MPESDRKPKREWAFFISPDGRITYNRLCCRCIHGCKQSYRAVIVACPKFRLKSRK